MQTVTTSIQDNNENKDKPYHHDFDLHFLELL